MNIENFSTLKEYQKPQTTPISPFKNTQNNETITANNVFSKLIGMNASQALFELTKLGYKVEIEGRGVVKQISLKGKNQVLISLSTGG